MTRLRFTTIQFTSSSMAGLRGRQSVRTTFKLTEKAISGLSVFAAQMGIKQKSLFDHLIDDTAALQTIAKEYRQDDLDAVRVPKTFVVSRRTLETLEAISQRYGTPRDALVEYSIRRLYPLLSEEKEKHQQRKLFHDEMVQVMQRGMMVLEQAKMHFDQDDPVYLKYLHLMDVFEGGCEDVSLYLDKGDKVMEFE